MTPLSKNTYREILRSPGRFLAILAIIVLGSGFFVGLRVSQKAMTDTADTYLDKTAFYDFSVATTLGLTDGDVEALLSDPEVLDAEGSFETDALVNLGGSTDQVFAFHSLPERVNVPDLVEGRMPASPDECLADSWTNLSIGDKVTLSAQNDSDTLDLFAVREFTVTGIATSPLYLNFERGSTALGTGSVTAFCYVPMGAFDADYYTAVYLRAPDMPDAYTDEYDDRAEALEDHFTDLANARAQSRYNTVLADAEAELADGQKEYDEAYNEYITGRADAEAGLADAKKELEDARRELEDAARKIEDGKKELEDGKAELSDNEQTLLDAQKELLDAKAELDGAQKEIADGRAAYDDGVAEFEARRADGEKELADAKAALDGALKTLEDGEAQYAENLKLYEDGKARYAEGAAQIEESERALEDGERRYALGYANFNEGLALYEENKAALDEAEERVEASRDTVKTSRDKFDMLMGIMLSRIGESFPDRQFSSAEELLACLRTAVDSGSPEDMALVAAVDQILSELKNFGAPDGTADLLTAYDRLLSAEKMLSDYDAGRAALAEAEAQLESAEAELAASRRELDDGWAELEEGRQALAESRTQLDDAKKRLDDGRSELDGGWNEYNDGAAELEASRAEFDASIAQAEAELNDAKRELEDAEARYADGLAEYESGLVDYNDGLRKYNDGKEEIAGAERELADAERKYADGLAQYKDGLAEYEDAKAEADRKFADAEAELADAKLELEDARREIDKIEYPDAYLLGRWSNLGYVCFENDASIVRSVSSVFPVFFFLVAALICVTTVSRMVEEERSQLGVLMALGYSRAKVMGKFLFYSGTATVIGCAAGILLGSKLIPMVIWEAYKIMYSFSDSINFYFDFTLSGVTFALYLIAMMAVTWLSCRKEINDVPANVIRPKPPKAGKRVILERVPFIWNRLSFLWKVTIRNIFRYKLRVLMMILGVAGCTALMLTGMGVNDSVKNVVDYQFTEISLYDYTVTFADPVTDDGRREFIDQTADFAEDTLFLHQTSVTALAGRSEKEVQLSAVDAEQAENVSKFMDFHRGSKKLAFPQKGEALLNSALAESLKVDTGDTVSLRFEDAPSLTLTVSGVFDNYLYNTIYINSDTLPWETEINCAMVLKNDAADAGAAMAELVGLNNVLSVSSSSEMRTRIGNMMASLIYIVLLTVICAAALAFVVIYNLTNINIQERLREIATVKVLGFYNFESALYVLRENILLTLLGAAAGIPLGLALNSFVVGEIRLDMIHFTPRVALPSYFASVALTILFALLVDLFMLRRLNTIEPASALKAAE